MKNFAIIGVGGYIAPRHIQAINETGNRIVCATDINDSVGILDRYTQDVAFFKDFERFQEHIQSLKGSDKEVNFVTICSPNYLHTPHMKFALSHGCDVICEKPLVLNESQIDEVKEYEAKFGKKVYGSQWDVKQFCYKGRGGYLRIGIYYCISKRVFTFYKN